MSPGLNLESKNNQSGSYSVQDLRLNGFSIFDHFEGNSSLLWFQMLVLIDFIHSIDRLSILLLLYFSSRCFSLVLFISSER